MNDIKVLIVKDEPMVAYNLKSFIEALDGFTVIGITENRCEAFDILDREKPDLVILDYTFSDFNSSEVISFARTKDITIDFIIVTSVNNGRSISLALRLGIVDYIIKPFKIERFTASLVSYREFFSASIR